jgi:hypothetical protein
MQEPGDPGREPDPAVQTALIQRLSYPPQRLRPLDICSLGDTSAHLFSHHCMVSGLIFIIYICLSTT